MIAGLWLAAAGVSGCSGPAIAEVDGQTRPVSTAPRGDAVQQLLGLRQAAHQQHALLGAEAPSFEPCLSEDTVPFAHVSPLACQRLSIRIEGMTFHAVHLSTGRRQLAIYHEGHGITDATSLADASYPDARILISRLLQNSDVLYMDMPLLGVNSGQTVPVGGRAVRTHGHEWFALKDDYDRSGLRFFLSPLCAALDALAAPYERVDMIGRSGGGWATTIFSALDTRISVSISVAGTAPLPVRGADVDGRDDIGDWEQFGAAIYRTIDYEDFYALAGQGHRRRHVQLYLERDNCCFSGAKGRLAEATYAARYADQFAVRFIVLDAHDHYSMPIEAILSVLTEERAASNR